MKSAIEYPNIERLAEVTVTLYIHFSCYNSTSLIKRCQLVKHHGQLLKCGGGSVPMVKRFWSATLLLMIPKLQLALLHNTRLESCPVLYSWYIGN